MSNSTVARHTGVSVRSVVDSMPRLVRGGHMEPLEQPVAGRATAYKLTAEQFATPEVIVTNGAGAHLVARENLDAFREKEKLDGLRKKVRSAASA